MISNNITEQIAKRIKEARLNQGMTGKEAAGKLGIAASTLSQYESGKSEPSFEMVIKISKLYNSNIDYLLTGEVPKEEKDIKVNDEEYSLVKAYRELDDYTRGQVDMMIQISIKNRHPDQDA